MKIKNKSILLKKENDYKFQVFVLDFLISLANFKIHLENSINK